MAKSDYLPPRDNDFLVWHDQLNAGLPSQAAAFGLAAADTAAVTADK